MMEDFVSIFQYIQPNKKINANLCITIYYARDKEIFNSDFQPIETANEAHKDPEEGNKKICKRL